MRLDIYLTEYKLTTSRHKAQETIKRGFVTVNGKVVTKPSATVFHSDAVIITEPLLYVSRAGDKLAHALQTFAVNPNGMTCLDIGSSTGGFTDCLLQQGAARIVAVDVGTDQLDRSLQNDPRIELFEKTDIRSFTTDIVFDLVVCDVSFISLTHIIPELQRFLNTTGKAILLVKPQYETMPNERTKSGIVKKDVSLAAIFEKITNSAHNHGLRITTPFEPVPVKGTDGNQEYVVMLERNFD